MSDKTKNQTDSIVVRSAFTKQSPKALSIGVKGEELTVLINALIAAAEAADSEGAVVSIATSKRTNGQTGIEFLGSTLFIREMGPSTTKPRVAARFVPKKQTTAESVASVKARMNAASVG